MTEEWRDVLGYDGYYKVSNLGRVMRTLGGRGATAGRILSLKQPSRSCDYIRVQLCRRDARRTLGVHVLVAEAFHGKRPRGKFPNHRDLNKTNNRADNLEWLTRRQNQRHALQNGRKPGRPCQGEANPRAKLSAAQVREIIAQKGRIGQRTLAALCGVSKTAIQLIHQGKRWLSEWPEGLRVREMPEARP